MYVLWIKKKISSVLGASTRSKWVHLKFCTHSMCTIFYYAYIPHSENSEGALDKIAAIFIGGLVSIP